MELIDICYPDTSANNLRYSLEKELEKENFVSNQWYVFTNEEHNLLIIRAKINNHTQVEVLKTKLDKLKDFFLYTYQLEIVRNGEEWERDQSLSITISILDIDYSEYNKPVFQTAKKVKIEKLSKTINREELISICEDSIVPWQNWQNRDSGSSQYLVSDIYSMLKAGCDYETHYESEDTIWITFYNITYEIIRDAIDNHYLSYDDIDEYKEAYPDEEMFYGYGLSLGEVTKDKLKEEDFDLSGYLPSRKRLIACAGSDWY